MNVKYKLVYCDIPTGINEVTREVGRYNTIYSFNGEIVCSKNYEKWIIKGDWLPNIKNDSLALVKNPPEDYRELLGRYVILEIENYDDWKELDSDQPYCSGYILRKLGKIKDNIGIFISKDGYESNLPLTRIKKEVKYYTI